MNRSGKPVFEPMPGKIVVDLITDDEIGGILIPAQYQKTRVMGIIRQLGTDEGDGDFYDLAIGDTVLFSQNSGIEVTVDRVKVLVLRTSEILCKVRWPDGESPGGKAQQGDAGWSGGIDTTGITAS